MNIKRIERILARCRALTTVSYYRHDGCSDVRVTTTNHIDRDGETVAAQSITLETVE